MKMMMMMIEVLRSAMDIAYQKAIQHPKDNGPIQFLNGCCRFYELAAILVDGAAHDLPEKILLETRRCLQERVEAMHALIDAAEKDKEVKNSFLHESRDIENDAEFYNNHIQQMGRDLEILKDVFGTISGDDDDDEEEEETRILELELELDFHKAVIKNEMEKYEIESAMREEEEEEILVVPSSARKWENEEEESLIQVLDSVLRCLEREEDLVMSASSEIEQHSVRHYLEIFRTEEREEREAIQWLLDSDESILSSVNIKLTKALKQLLTSKELLLDLEQGLGLCPNEEEDYHGNQESNYNNNNVGNVAIEEGDNNAFSSLRRFQQVLTDFEDTVLAGLDSNCERITELERQMQELAHPIVSLKKKKRRYKKAFLARCRSLHLAEIEVDMLGDQVDSLLQFLEKICKKLSKNSSFLSCHFEVSDMVRLIKKELANCTPKNNA